MKLVASKLIKFGMDFDYENNGSEGESIRCHPLGFILENKEGFLKLESEGSQLKVRSTADGMLAIMLTIHEIIIKETN